MVFVLIRSMLSAIYLNDNSFLKTYKIDNEVFDRLLSPELYTIHLPSSKSTPQ